MKRLLQLISELFTGCKQQLILVALIRCLPCHAHAAEIPPNSLGYQFYSKTLDVVWKSPTNQLPATARTFKVVPFTFSHAVISNLTSWGGFAETNRVVKSDDCVKPDHNTLVYQKNGNRQSLVIDPAEGLACLDNPMLSWEIAEGVPDESRACFLATNILARLGIGTNELILEHGMPKAWFYPGETTSRGITRRSHMGVEFRRQVNGVPGTLQYVRVEFENREQITRLEINWRGLKPSKPYPVATPQQMVAWIKEGRARVQSLEGPMGARWIQTADIKRITIVAATAHYSDATRFLGGREEEIGRLYPYAVLQADAEISRDDHETIWLFCPMIATDLNRPSRAATNDLGFSVYPSRLREKQEAELDTH